MGDPARSALSWLQAGRLRREAEQGRIRNCTTLFALPDDATDAVLRERLAVMVAREDALRVTEIALDDGGYAVYTDPALPVRYVRVESGVELAGVVDEMVYRGFARHGRPLWELAVLEHAGERGRPARTVCAVFDHLVSDRRSTRLFRDEILTGRTDGRRGRFRDFVAWQRTEFPGHRGVTTAAREFWLRHLDGTPADRGPALPFGGGPPSGTAQSTVREVPVPADALRAAAARARSSPFVLLLASVVSATGEVTNADDVTLRVSVPGRPLAYRDTLGWFSDCVPVRVRHSALGNAASALEATRAAWLATMPFHTTPWDYICETDEAGTPGHPSPLYVNFFADPNVDAAFARSVGNSVWWTTAETTGSLKLVASVVADGRWQIGCRFDPSRFAREGVDAFLTLVTARLSQLVAGDDQVTPRRPGR